MEIRWSTAPYLQFPSYKLFEFGCRYGICNWSYRTNPNLQKIQSCSFSTERKTPPALSLIRCQGCIALFQWSHIMYNLCFMNRIKWSRQLYQLFKVRAPLHWAEGESDGWFLAMRFWVAIDKFHISIISCCSVLLKDFDQTYEKQQTIELKSCV